MAYTLIKNKAKKLEQKKGIRELFKAIEMF